MERTKTVGSSKEAGSCLPIVNFQSGQQRAISLRLWLSWRQTRPALWVLSITMSILCSGVLPVGAQESSNLNEMVQPLQPSQPAQESSDIAKAAQNPIAHMISVPLENDFYPQTGINKENEYSWNKARIPIPLSSNWNLITRTIIPVIQTPELVPGINGTSGLGDIQESLFFSPTKAGLGGIFGERVQPFQPPPPQSTFMGREKQASVLNIVVLKSQGHWLFGSLVQTLWSVELAPRIGPP